MLTLFIGFALGCITLLITALVKDFRHLAVARVFGLLLLASAGFLVHPLVPEGYSGITSSLQTMIPALFWLLCQFAFSEHPTVRGYWLLIVAYSALVPTCYWLLPLPDSALLELLLHRIPGYLEYLLIVGGLWVVMNNWSADLIESRRHLRVIITALVGSTVLMNVILVNFHWGDVLLQRFVVIVCLFGSSYYLLVIPKGVLFGVVDVAKPAVRHIETQTDSQPRQAEQTGQTEQSEPTEPTELTEPTVTAKPKAAAVQSQAGCSAAELEQLKGQPHLRSRGI